MITRSWPISCKRLRRRARTASWVCRKLWRIVTTGCLDGRIGRGYRKEPEGWCFDVHYHIMQDQNVYHLTPRLWLISTVKHPGGGGCCAAAAVERAQAPLFALTQLIGVHSASYARSRSRGTAQPDQS